MKKLLGLLIVAGATTGIAAGCSSTEVKEVNVPTTEKETSVYGLVHGGYVGAATVSVKDGKIFNVSIDETVSKVMNQPTSKFEFTTEANAMAGFGMALPGADAKILTADKYNAFCWKYLENTTAKLSATASERTVSPTITKVLDLTSATDDTAKAAAFTGFTCSSDEGTKVGSNTGSVAFPDSRKPAAKQFFLAPSVTLPAAIVESIRDAKGTYTYANSKRLSQYTVNAYMPGTNTQPNGWLTNIDNIEKYFEGKTWAEIKDLNLSTKDAVNTAAGATLNDSHHYASLVVEAARQLLVA